LCGTILVEMEKGVDKSERIDTIFTQVILTIFFVVMPVLLSCSLACIRVCWSSITLTLSLYTCPNFVLDIPNWV
jgi:hypothetical protein